MYIYIYQVMVMVTRMLELGFETRLYAWHEFSMLFWYVLYIYTHTHIYIYIYMMGF